MKPLKTIAKGAGIVFVGILISKLFTYFYRVIVARIGVEEYGLLSLALAVIGIIGMVVMMGLNMGVLRYVAFYKAKNDEERIKGTITTAIKIVLPLSILFSILLFFFSDKISLIFFHNIKLSSILKIFAFVIPFFSLKEIFLSSIKAFKKIEYEVFARNIIENLVKILLTVILIILGYGLFGAAIAYVLSIIATFFVSFYLLEKKTFAIVKTKIKSIFEFKELFFFSLPLMFSILLSQVIVWTDVLMIGYFKTTSDVGIYNAALPTASLISIVPGGLIALFIPVMTELFVKKEKKRKEKEEFKQTLKISTKWIFFINFPLFLLLILFSKEILKFLFGQEYIIGYLALYILAVGYLIHHIFFTSNEVLNVIKKSKIILFNAMIAAITNIFLNYILIPKYGIIGGAIATSISLIIYSLLAFIEVYLFTKIISLKLNYFKAIIAGLVSLLITHRLIRLFKYISLYHIIILSIIFLIFYSMLILILKSLEKEDIEILKMIEKKSGFKLFFFRNFIKKFI